MLKHVSAAQTSQDVLIDTKFSNCKSCGTVLLNRFDIVYFYFIYPRKSGRPFTITVEGNVGSGKTTLLGTEYSDEFKCRLCLGQNCERENAKNMNERSVCKVPMSLRFLNFSYPIEISSALLVSEMHSKIDECSV